MVSCALNEIDCCFRFLLAFEVLVNQLLKRVHKAEMQTPSEIPGESLHFDVFIKRVHGLLG